MKKTILALLFMVTTLNTFAQQEGLYIAPTLTLGGSGGGGNGSTPKSFNASFSHVLGIGAEATYMLKNKIGFGAGLSFGNYGTWYRTTFENKKTSNMLFAYSTIDVPIFFRYTAGKSNQFFVNVGIINHFKLGAHVGSDVNGSFELRKDKYTNTFPGYSISPFIYFGANIRCSDKINLMMGPELRYQIGSNGERKLNFSFKVGLGIRTSKAKKSTITP